MVDPWAEKMSKITDAVRKGSGALSADIRQAIMSGAPVSEPLASYIRKVADNAGAVTDEDVRALMAAGYSEDQIFEATVSSALGAGMTRLEAGLAALRRASDAD